MRMRTAAISFLVVIFLLGAFPGRAAAEDGDSAAEVKSKRKRVKKKGGRNKKASSADEQVDADPYGDATVESRGETAAAEEAEEQETESDEAADETSADSAPEGNLGSLRRSNRMEFDERLIKGQAAKSGAVYLFKRVPRALPGLVPMRRSYRRRIVEPVLGMRELKAAKSSTDDNDEVEAVAPKSEKVEAPSPEEQASDSASAAPPPEEETKDKKQNGQGRKRRGGKK